MRRNSLVYAALGQPDKAIEFHLQHLEIARQIKDRRGESTALSNLGTAYADLGQAQKGIEHLETALYIGQEIKNPEIICECTTALRRLHQEEGLTASRQPGHVGQIIPKKIDNVVSSRKMR